MRQAKSSSAPRQFLRGGLLLSFVFLNSAFAQNLCVARLSPLVTFVPAAGGTFSLSVTVPDQTLCPWSGAATPPASIVSTTPSKDFIGNSTILFTVPANTGTTALTGSITVSVTGLAGSGFQGQPTNFSAQIIQTANNSPQLFNDVASTNPNFDYINIFKNAGMTAGCTAAPPNYCPDSTATRGQLAAFTVRGMSGESFFFTTVPYFTDVPASHPQFKYIQRLADLGIATSMACGAGLYCPDSNATRGFAAMMLMRAKFLATAPAGTQLGNSFVSYFADVPPANPAFPFVQKMRDLGITVGCTAIQFCVDQPITRASAAVFTTRTFLTPYFVYAPKF